MGRGEQSVRCAASPWAMAVHFNYNKFMRIETIAYLIIVVDYLCHGGALALVLARRAVGPELIAVAAGVPLQRLRRGERKEGDD